MDKPVFDGVTGRGRYAGRRIHVIQLLRDSHEPMSVEQVARKAGIPLATARFHLEALVDAGFAVREAEDRPVRGRPRLVYAGHMPDRAHERGQAYRVLAATLAQAVGQSSEDPGPWMYRAGQEASRSQLPPKPWPTDDVQIVEAMLDKMDAMAFAPDEVDPCLRHVVMHHCPFADAACRYPQAFCQMHAGMMNGHLEALGAELRVVKIRPQLHHHLCDATLGKPKARLTSVELDVPAKVRTTSVRAGVKKDQMST
ncbi:MAG: helix-turn-helix domain-containing protein [Propionibacteriaceae bacterium]|jgi:predicted ArsR family transcriptional regulator|nr:helix-turn-helix domain-containing protein [Propionibacteriaceae bacterium]